MFQESVILYGSVEVNTKKGDIILATMNFTAHHSALMQEMLFHAGKAIVQTRMYTRLYIAAALLSLLLSRL